MPMARAHRLTNLQLHCCDWAWIETRSALGFKHQIHTLRTHTRARTHTPAVTSHQHLQLESTKAHGCLLLAVAAACTEVLLDHAPFAACVTVHAARSRAPAVTARSSAGPPANSNSLTSPVDVRWRFDCFLGTAQEWSNRTVAEHECSKMWILCFTKTKWVQ